MNTMPSEVRFPQVLLDYEQECLQDACKELRQRVEDLKDALPASVRDMLIAESRAPAATLWRINGYLHMLDTMAREWQTPRPNLEPDEESHAV